MYTSLIDCTFIKHTIIGRKVNYQQYFSNPHLFRAYCVCRGLPRCTSKDHTQTSP